MSASIGLAGIVFIATCSIPTYAYEMPLTTSSSLVPPDVQGIFSNFKLPGPIQEFIEKAKEVSQSVSPTTQNLNFKNINPRNILDYLDEWLSSITWGKITFTGTVRFVGNGIVWVLTFLANLIARGLSFL